MKDKPRTIHTKLLLDHRPTLCFCSLTSEVRWLVDRLRKKTYEEMFSTRESTYHLMNRNTYYRGEWGLKCHTCRPHEAIPLVRMTQTLLMDDRVTPSVPKVKHEVTFWNCLYSFYSVRTGKYVSIELYISKTFAFLTDCVHFSLVRYVSLWFLNQYAKRSNSKVSLEECEQLIPEVKDEERLKKSEDQNSSSSKSDVLQNDLNLELS